MLNDEEIGKTENLFPDVVNEAFKNLTDKDLDALRNAHPAPAWFNHSSAKDLLEQLTAELNSSNPPETNRKSAHMVTWEAWLTDIDAEYFSNAINKFSTIYSTLHSNPSTFPTAMRQRAIVKRHQGDLKIMATVLIYVKEYLSEGKRNG